jgi:hypothetical protein
MFDKYATTVGSEVPRGVARNVPPLVPSNQIPVQMPAWRMVNMTNLLAVQFAIAISEPSLRLGVFLAGSKNF